MSQNTAQDPKPTLYELERYSLFTPVPDNQRASLNWGVRDGYPRVTVFTRTQSDKEGKGFITVPFDIDTFVSFLNQFHEFTKSKEKIVRAVTSKVWPRDDTGKITGDMEVRSRLMFGKDDEGIMFLVVEDMQETGRPRIKFPILLSDFHEFKDADGTPLTSSEGSCRRVQTMVENLKRVIVPACATLRDTSIPRPQRQFGGKRQNNGGGGGQSQARANVASESFDDISF